MGSELATHLMALPVVQKVKELSRRSERRSVVLRELPTLLDVVTLGLSSGLSFDASLDLYCQRYDTSLAASFAESMLSWRVGVKGRAEALDDLANRLDVVALRRFAAAVTQALAFGSPLAETLDQQAQAIRDEQRSELEAEIERVPVKMLIPLGTLIVPAMLLSILGPLLGSSVAFV
jgi:tight adherence protein C